MHIADIHRDAPGSYANGHQHDKRHTAGACWCQLGVAPDSIKSDAEDQTRKIFDQDRILRRK